MPLWAYYTIVFAFIFLFGICIGSFLNVCIYRLPKDESLIKRNSHCMTCGAEIKRYDLIPVFSWLLLRGKCRSCKAPISPRYCFVEALNGILYVLVFAYYGFMYNPFRAMIVCLLFSALIVVFFMDWDTQLISNYMVIFIAILSILDYLCAYFEIDKMHINSPDLKNRIIAVFIVSIPFLIIELASKERAMGRGDVYLMAAAGAFLGIKGVLVALFIGLVSGSIVGLILKYKTGLSKFAFGPYLAVGIATAALFSEQIGNCYLRFAGFIE